MYTIPLLFAALLSLCGFWLRHRALRRADAARQNQKMHDLFDQMNREMDLAERQHSQMLRGWSAEERKFRRIANAKPSTLPTTPPIEVNLAPANGVELQSAASIIEPASVSASARPTRKPGSPRKKQLVTPISSASTQASAPPLSAEPASSSPPTPLAKTWLHRCAVAVRATTTWLTRNWLARMAKPIWTLPLRIIPKSQGLFRWRRSTAPPDDAAMLLCEKFADKNRAV